MIEFFKNFNWSELFNKLLHFLFDLVTSYGIKVLAALFLLVIGLKISSIIVKRVRKSKLYHKADESVAHFLVNILNIGLKVLVIVSAALVLGVPAASFVALLTSGGVAIGLALQGSLSNFAGGIMILLYKPFKNGDYIEYGDYAGTVVDISIFYTVLNTPDNKVVHCPNGALSNANVINYSQRDTRRVELKINYAYGTDPEFVNRILLDVASRNDLISDDPAPFCRLHSCNDSALTSVLRVWCHNADYWTVYFDLTEQVTQALNANNIVIPYPQMDVHVK